MYLDINLTVNSCNNRISDQEFKNYQILLTEIPDNHGYRNLQCINISMISNLKFNLRNISEFLRCKYVLREKCYQLNRKSLKFQIGEAFCSSIISV